MVSLQWWSWKQHILKTSSRLTWYICLHLWSLEPTTNIQHKLNIAMLQVSLISAMYFCVTCHLTLRGISRHHQFQLWYMSCVLMRFSYSINKNACGLCLLRNLSTGTTYVTNTTSEQIKVGYAESEPARPGSLSWESSALALGDYTPRELSITVTWYPGLTYTESQLLTVVVSK